MQASFGWLDWGIVLACVGAAVTPGFLLRRFVHDQADFLVAGRTLSAFLATATLTATEMGLVTVMYMAQMGFLHGFSSFSLGIIMFVAMGFTGVTGFLVGGLRASGVATFAEYYELRYGRGVRLLGGAILATAGIVNYGVFLRLEAEFIRSYVGIPDMVLSSAGAGWSVSVPALELVMSVLVVVVLGYTLLGGMVSVVVTDYVQFILLTVGMGVATYFVLTDEGIGGLSGMAAAVETHRPVYGMNPLATGRLGDALLGLGGIYIAWQVLHWTATSTWQTMAFRTTATVSPTTTRWMWVMTAVNYLGRGVIPMLWGVAALTYFAGRGTEEGASGATVDSIRAMPLYLGALLPVGARGFLLAGMLAALMSTHSSYLLAWSGVLTEDLLVPGCKAVGVELGDRVRLWITRGFIVVLCAYIVVFGLWYEVKASVWGFLAVTGTMYMAGAATLLGFGLYWRRANIAGAYMGLLAGALPGFVYLAFHMTELYAAPDGQATGLLGWIVRANVKLTDPWVGLVSYPLGVGGMVVGSLLFARPSAEATEGPVVAEAGGVREGEG